REYKEFTHNELPSAPVKQNPYGTLAGSGYHIERLIYESEPGIVIPSLLYVPDAGADKKPALLMIVGEGKADSAAEADEFVKAGVIVLSIDARGLGEARVTAEASRRGADHYIAEYR